MKIRIKPSGGTGGKGDPGDPGIQGPAGPAGVAGQSPARSIDTLASDVPFGYMGQSTDRRLTTGATSVASGRLFLSPLWLNEGDTVEDLTYLSAGTAMAGGTHCWAALYDQSRNLLTQTVNDTAPTWAAQSGKTFTLPSPWVAKYTGWHYAGLNAVATTMMSLIVSTAPGVLAQFGDILGGGSSTGLTTTAPASAAVPSQGNMPWVAWRGRPSPNKFGPRNMRTQIGVLRGNDSGVDREQLVDNDVTSLMYEINWGALQPNGAGTALDVTLATTIANNIKSWQAMGAKVTLGLGLHFQPSWLFSTYGNAVRFKNADGQWTDGDGGNAVFSQQMRVLYRDFFTKLNAYIPFGSLYAIRITSGGRLELLYPQDTSDYWCFDDAAMTGTGLAEGQVVNPAPLVVPSSNARPVAERRAFAYWYVDSLANVANWQMDELDKLGFTGYFHIMMPGVGSRPSQTESDITSTLPRSAVLAQGVAWWRIAQKLRMSAQRPARRIVLWCSDLAKSSTNANNIPQRSDRRVAIDPSVTTLNAWDSARYIKRLADEHGYNWGGECPGRAYVSSTADYDSPTGLQERARQIVLNNAGRAIDYQVAHAQALFVPGREPLLAKVYEIAAQA